MTTEEFNTILKEQGDKTYMGEDTVYKYSVIGKYEKDGKKYDLVRYYFTIEDYQEIKLLNLPNKKSK